MNCIYKHDFIDNALLERIRHSAAIDKMSTRNCLVKYETKCKYAECSNPNCLFIHSSPTDKNEKFKEFTKRLELAIKLEKNQIRSLCEKFKLFMPKEIIEIGIKEFTEHNVLKFNNDNSYVTRYDSQLIFNSDCPICFNVFSAEDDVFKLPCGHAHHIHCDYEFRNYISNNSHMKSECPLCKANCALTISHFSH